MVNPWAMSGAERPIYRGAIREVFANSRRRSSAIPRRSVALRNSASTPIAPLFVHHRLEPKQSSPTPSPDFMFVGKSGARVACSAYWPRMRQRMQHVRARTVRIADDEELVRLVVALLSRPTRSRLGRMAKLINEHPPAWSNNLEACLASRKGHADR